MNSLQSPRIETSTAVSTNHNGRKGSTARQQHELHKRRMAAGIRRAERRAERSGNQVDLSWARAEFEAQTGTRYIAGGAA